jgi:hypothetical protein
MTNLHKRFLGIGIVVSIFIIAVVSFTSFDVPTSRAEASPSPAPLFGWAWSSGNTQPGGNIGWISFNSQNTGSVSGGPYSVTIDPSGKLNGYAWAGNIGWIKFGGLSSFPPSGSNQFDAKVTNLSSNSQVFGWARACSGTVSGDCSSMTSRTDGWDGWIELTSVNYNIVNPKTGDVKITGYAWGSVNVGWLGLNLFASGVANTGGAGVSCSIKENPPHTLTWTSQNTTVCTVDTSPTPTTGGSSGTIPNINPASNTKYKLSCTPTVPGSQCVGYVTVIGSNPPALPSAIPMWLNNDVRSAVKIRVGQTVTFNWDKTGAATYTGCTGTLDNGVGTIYSGSTFPGQVPKSNLPIGIYSFTLTCIPTRGSPVSATYKIDPTITSLQVQVVDSTIKEK